MSPDKLILYARHIDGKGGSARIEEVRSIHVPEDNRPGYSWFNLKADHLECRELLTADGTLDPIIVEELLVEDTRPRALAKDNGLLVTLRAMNLQDKDHPEDMISIRIWLEERRVVTTRQRDIKAIADIKDMIKAGAAPHSPGDFLIAITDRLFSRMSPFIIDLEDRLLRAEQMLSSSEGLNHVAAELGLIRKQVVVFARYIAPQKAAIQEMIKADLTWLGPVHKEHLVESLNQVTQYVEELNELRDRSQILSDSLNSAHTRRLTDITYVFSIVATVFLPLGFMTGILGVNVGGMPGVDNPLAFWIVLGTCALIAVALLWTFRKLRLF